MNTVVDEQVKTALDGKRRRQSLEKVTGAMCGDRGGGLVVAVVAAAVTL